MSENDPAFPCGCKHVDQLCEAFDGCALCTLEHGHDAYCHECGHQWACHENFKMVMVPRNSAALAALDAKEGR